MAPLIKELPFYLGELIHRYIMYTTGRYPPDEIVDEIAMRIWQILQEQTHEEPYEK